MIVQINLHRSKAASAALTKFLEEHPTFVVLVQEPWTVMNKVCGKIPHTNLHVHPATAKRPRACIYTSKNIKGWQMAEFTDSDNVTIQITNTRNKKGNIAITSTYMAAEEPAPTTKVRSVARHCRINKQPLLIGGDANSHHTLWGSTNTNDRGDALLAFILEEELQWKNVGDKPTFQTRARAEVLDITIVNTQANEMIQDWKVDETPSLSDHAYITYKLGKLPLKAVKMRNIKRTDWDKYGSSLENKLLLRTPCLNTAAIDEIERAVEQVEVAITEAFHEACPERIVQVKPHLQWWNKKLDKLQKEVSRAHLQAKRSRVPRAWDSFHNIQRSLRKEMAKAKKLAWRSFTSTIEGAHPLSRVLKAIRTDASLQVTSVTSNGKLTSSPEETLEVLLSHHVPNTTNEEGREKVEARTGSGQDAHKKDNKWIASTVNDQTLKQGLEEFKPWKSPGADGIYPGLLQKGWNKLGPFYKAIYTACLHKGYTPTSWRKARGVFIPKPGKQTYTEVKSYRMITLTSFQLKLLERVILKKINRTKGVTEILSPLQFGFKAGVSTDTALHTLVHKIEKATAQNQYALAIFLDIENAFPTVTFEAIDRAISRLPLETGMTKWIKSSLRQRSLTATLADKSITKEITRGCPQGGILSPFLWNAVMDELLKECNENKLYTQAYADDIAGVIIGIDPATLVQRAQVIINKTVEWGRRNGLRVSETKSEAVLFSLKRKDMRPRKKLRIGTKELEFSTSAKYLGVTLDSKLTFNDHAKSRTAKALALMAQTRRLVGKTWGITPHMAKWIYQVMILPMVTYGSVVWHPNVETKKTQTMLTKLQRTACLMITSAYPGTPTAAMEVLLGLKPLRIIIQREAILASIRLETSGHWNEQKIAIGSNKLKYHTDTCNNKRKELATLDLPRDRTVPTQWGARDFHCTIKAREETTANESSIPKEHIKCFTDGSKLEDGLTGAGVVLYQGYSKSSWHRHLGARATVFQAEVTAITEAALELLGKGTTGQTIHILSDSQAALKAVSAHKTDRKTVAEAAEFLDKLAQNNSVQLHWIPGHEGTTGNEAADQKAKEGASTVVFGPEPFLPIPEALVKGEAHAWAEAEHKREWNSRKDCRQTKEAIDWPERKLITKMSSLKREDLRLLIQVITGHCNLNRHRSIQGKTDTPLCQKCYEEEETPNHIISSCLYWKAERDKWLGTGPTNLNSQLKKQNTSHLIGLMKETNRFLEF